MTKKISRAAENRNILFNNEFMYFFLKGVVAEHPHVAVYDYEVFDSVNSIHLPLLDGDDTWVDAKFGISFSPEGPLVETLAMPSEKNPLKPNQKRILLDYKNHTSGQAAEAGLFLYETSRDSARRLQELLLLHNKSESETRIFMLMSEIRVLFLGMLLSEYPDIRLSEYLESMDYRDEISFPYPENPEKLPAFTICMTQNKKKVTFNYVSDEKVSDIYDAETSESMAIDDAQAVATRAMQLYRLSVSNINVLLTEAEEISLREKEEEKRDKMLAEITAPLADMVKTFFADITPDDIGKFQKKVKSSPKRARKLLLELLSKEQEPVAAA